MSGQWDDGDALAPGPLQRFDLADLVERPQVRPKIHEGGIYPAKLHVVGGEPGHGKSTVVIYWLLKAIERGHPVVMLDWEAGSEHTADLLRSFGADRIAVSKHLHYFPHPDLSWSAADVAGLAGELRGIKPVIAAFDSSIAILSAMGGGDNDASAVRRMWTTLAPIAHTLGCAVIATDHSGKDAAESRYNRGSTDKLAAVDVNWKLVAEQQFSRHQDGKLIMTCTKDRPGWLHWFWEITVTRDPLTLHWKKTGQRHRDGAEMAAGKVAILAAVTTEPSTRSEIVSRKAAMPNGTGMSRNWSTTYLNELADAGIVERISQGPGTEVLWCLPAQPVEPGPGQETLPS